ncbi:hypothetical protein BBJ29_007752 [Phytophthora kernoviae]|uniref:Uncharacterized protein n=1 Tax=Phytophthora kernoviae TaxID=325452 RepID=A0A3F2REB5_9STRA|nr:hypothetical protein BBJ29_007752 [Phytophthora kernoviae]RLN54677.1 hypothetical protein BBP00_00008832 [Phytophthora kernoviae]
MKDLLVSKSYGTVRFRYYPLESFRFEMKIYQNHARIWLESRRSKQQWECKVGDVSKHAPDDTALPRDVVFSCIAQALETETAAIGLPVIDLLRQEKEGPLHLVVLVALGPVSNTTSVIHSKYSFPLTPLALDRVDKMKSQLRDLEECVEELQRSLQLRNA